MTDRYIVTKGNLSEVQQTLPAKGRFFPFFLFPEKVRTGIACAADGTIRYAVVIYQKNSWRLLFAGNTIPFFLRVCAPALFYGDSGSVPLQWFNTIPGAGIDPATWIDMYGEEAIPEGFPDGSLHTSYKADGDSVVAVSVVTEQFKKTLSMHMNNGCCVSCVPPLQGLAWIWKERLNDPYEIWKVFDTYSIMVLVKNGSVIDSCTVWIGKDAIEREPEQCCTEAKNIATSLQKEGKNRECIIVADEAVQALLKQYWGTDSPVHITILNDPKVDYAALEAYGNTLVEEKRLQLLSFDMQLPAEKREQWVTACIKTIRYALYIVAILTGVASVCIGIGTYVTTHERSVMSTLDREYEYMEMQTEKRDSLLNEIRKRTKRMSKESILTRLLTELQLVFPEGAAAEEVTIAERDATSWRIVIRVFAQSSTLIQPVIGNLKNIKGVNDVRMVYSEQVAGKKNSGGIRFKIEAVWR